MKYSIEYSVDYLIPIDASSAEAAETLARREIDIPGIRLTITPIRPEIGDVISGAEAAYLPVGSVVIHDEDRGNGFVEPFVKVDDGWHFYGAHLGFDSDAHAPEASWGYYVALVGR